MASGTEGELIELAHQSLAYLFAKLLQADFACQFLRRIRGASLMERIGVDFLAGIHADRF